MGNGQEPGTGGASGGRGSLVVACNVLMPFRVHWHQRIAREIPELALRTLLVPCREKWSWDYHEGNTPAELGLVRFVPDRPRELEALEIVRADTPFGRVLSPRGLWIRARSAWAEWRNVSRVLAWLEEVRPRAMLVYGYAGVYEARVLGWARSRGVPTLMWADSNIHSDRARGWRFVAKRAIVRRLMERADVLLPCGRLGAEFFRRYTTRHGDKVFACPLEPDYAQIESITPEDVGRVCESRGLDAARRRFVASCRLVALKRVDVLVRAFARIAGSRPEWDLLVVGDGPERANIESLVPAELRGRVRITGLITDQREVSALYRASHCFVHTSENEAWGVVVNEAAASGLPLVCTRVTGAAAELVEEGVNGRLVEPGDVEATARAMLECSEPGERERLARGSLEVVARFRRERDPIAGLRRGLEAAGVELDG